jgi:spiro-SPASM protein
MSQVLVINSLFISPWREKPFSSGKTVHQGLMKFINQYKDIPRIELLPLASSHSESDNPEQTGVIERAEKIFIIPDPENLVSTFKKIFEMYTQIIYFWSDTPFLDITLTNELINHHNRYLSQYTFSDGWPRGLTPEILENTAMEKLEILSRGCTEPLSRDILFTLIQKDINAFDLETLVAPQDFRLLRLLLAADSKENWTLLDRFDQEGLDNHKAINEGLNQKQELLRTLPAFYQIQITSERAQIPTYLPIPDFPIRGEISQENFARILDQIENFSHEAVVSLSYWGEPSLHSHIYSFMEQVLTRKGLTLLIETSGIGWNQGSLQSLITKYSHKMEWIVELDALEISLYEKLRGKGQEEALSFIDFLGPQMVGKLYIQTTRMIENEDHLETLYGEWKNRPGELIIKKYDHFCQRLPSKKVTDLSPIKRNPCWHIKRDMVILLDGTVLTCQESLDLQDSLGNILKEDIGEIWSRGENLYKEHIKENYPATCAECDEYYTYNF